MALKDKYYRFFILLLVLLQIVGMIFKFDLTFITFLVCIPIFALGITRLSNSFKIATAIFIVAGIVLLFTGTFSIYVLAKAWTSMIDIVVLLVVMQLFMLPVTVGNYQKAVEQFMENKLHTPKSIYVFVMLITHLLSSILSMGTVSIVISVLGDSIKRRVKDYEHFSGTAITRAFTLGTLWAPGAATIFLISTVTKVQWSSLFLPCILLGVLGLVLAYLMESKKAYLKPINKPAQSNLNKNKSQSLVPVLLAILGLLILSFVFMHFKIGSSMDSVTLAGIIVVSLWLLLLSLFKSKINIQPAAPAVKEYLNRGIFSGAALAPFFIAIGTFTYGFEHSQLSVLLIRTLRPIFAQLGWYLVILIPLIVVAASLIGIHPLASVALVGKIVMSAHIAMSPLLIALSLNIGSVIAYMVSPFAGIIIIVASLLNVKPTTISLRWNWLFCIMFAILGLSFSVLFSLI